MGSQPHRSDSITATGYPPSNGSCSIPAWGVGKQHPCRQLIPKHLDPSPAGWIPQFRTTARPPGCRKNFFVGCLMSRSSSSRELCRVQRKESSEGACCPPPAAPPLPGYLQDFGGGRTLWEDNYRFVSAPIFCLTHLSSKRALEWMVMHEALSGQNKHLQ